jgi:hypothetical protein
MKEAKRITLNLDDEVYKKLRQIQANEIRNTSDHVSFSKIINEVLGNTLKK